MRGLIIGVVGLVACAPKAPEDCPPGMLGCPCLDDAACNPGFECRSDVCRDDEDPTGTSTATSTTTSSTVTMTMTTTPPPTTTTGVTSVGPGSVGPVSTDPTIDPTSTGPGMCGCGWSDADNAYACGSDLPPIGPVGKGSPDCVAVAVEGKPCDSVEPPIDQYGCCFGGGSHVISCVEGDVVFGECTEVVPGICEPT